MSNSTEDETTQKRRLPKWALVSIVSASVLSSFAVIYFFILPILSLFVGPSTEDRYYYINNTLEAIDYESAGTVLESSYDDKSHWMSKAEFRAVIKGEDTFEILREKIVQTSRVSCGATDETVRCGQGRPRIDLVNNQDGTVLLVLTDSGSGK